MIRKTIGILGSGEVAKALALGFIRYGYQVKIGTRHPEDHTEWLAENPECSIGTFIETASYGHILVVALKGSAAADVLSSIPDVDLLGKTVIDTTVPVSSNPPDNNVLSFFTGPNESLMEDLQRTVPGANFVKGFSCVASSVMVDPPFAERPTMFICGNHGGAKLEVRHILDQFGWSVADMGGVESARAIEPLAMLTCIDGFVTGNWQIAYRLLKK